MHRILRCKYLQGGHLYDQLPRDPQAPQPGTQQDRDRHKLPVRPEYRGCNAAAGGELRLVVAAAGGNAGQATLRTPVPVQHLQARLQDARLRLCPQRTPAQRCYSKSALAGIL